MGRKQTEKNRVFENKIFLRQEFQFFTQASYILSYLSRPLAIKDLFKNVQIFSEG